MDFWEVIFLGILQGFTEFLPISSTAHLRVVPALLGWSDPGAAVTAVLQLGSLFALLVYFRREISRMALSLLGRNPSMTEGTPPRTLLVALFWGTVPIVVLGVLGRHWIRGEARSLWIVAGTLIGVGVLLWIAEKRTKGHRKEKDVRVGDGIWIGMAQSLALIPGVSRSGISIAAGLSLGFQRETAARFSFLLGIPALAGAGIFEFLEIREQVLGENLFVFLAGIAAAFLSSYLAIGGLLRYLRSRSIVPFAIYRILLGALIVALLVQGVLSPQG